MSMALPPMEAQPQQGRLGAMLSAMTQQQSGYSGRKPYDQMEETELVELVDKWFERVVENRRHVERDALLNIAFLLDHQYVKASTVGQTVRLVPTPKKKGTVRTVEQIIEPAVRSEMARLLRTKPAGIVVPQGDDPEDYNASKAADDTLQYVQQAHDWDEYQEQAILWILAGGTSHLYVGWDDEAQDEYGNQGDFVFRSLSIFEFGIPHLRKWRLQDQPYVMVTKAYELDEIEDTWGVTVEADRNEKFSTLDDRLQSIITTSSSKEVSTGTQGKNRNIPMAVVKEVWVKPNPTTAPAGMVLVVASGKVLDIKPWPAWCKGKYPFHKLEYMRVPGSYWGKPMITSMVPVQRRHNRAASIVVETMNLMAQTRLAAPKNTQVRGILSGKGVLFETPMGSTQGVNNISMPPMGDLPFKELENTRAAIRDISHQHEVSRGTTPPNVRSGTAISTLKELDDTASVIPVRSLERAVQGIGRHIISIVQEKWDEPRLVYILGTDGDLERKSLLSGTDVSGQFVVQSGTTFSYSRNQRQQEIMAWLEAGVISPEEAGKFAEVGTGRGVLRERYLTQRHAQRENQKFKLLSAVDPQTGQPNPQILMQEFNKLLPADWHDHETHLAEHNKIRMSPAYEGWESWRKALFDAHITGHIAAIEQQRVKTMQMQREMSGQQMVQQEPPPEPQEPANG